jgi:hypothetical protein
MERGNGGYLIHTSGTDILLNHKLFHGEKDTAEEVKVYDDWDNIKEVTSFPGKKIPQFSLEPQGTLNDHSLEDAHSHCPCDKVALSLSESHKGKVAVVCPPTIWGRG